MFYLHRRLEHSRDDNDIVSEANISLQLCSFLGLAVLFFTGLVILNLASLPVIVELPVVYLIISAVAFILSSVIYANVSGMNEKLVPRSKAIQLANWISEYPGMYLFLIAIPLLMLGVTGSALVQSAAAVACYGGLVLYALSPYSLDHRRYKTRMGHAVAVIVLAVFCITVYFTGILLAANLLPVGICGVVIIFCVSYFSFSNT